MPKPRRMPRPLPLPVEDVVIDVRAVTNAAFNAGLTIELADHLLVEADEWSHHDGVCPLSCDGARTRFVTVFRAFSDRDIIYCEGCQTADIGV